MSAATSPWAQHIIDSERERLADLEERIVCRASASARSQGSSWRDYLEVLDLELRLGLMWGVS